MLITEAPYSDCEMQNSNKKTIFLNLCLQVKFASLMFIYIHILSY
jgi:hypothetical protein